MDSPKRQLAAPLKNNSMGAKLRTLTFFIGSIFIVLAALAAESEPAVARYLMILGMMPIGFSILAWLTEPPVRRQNNVNWNRKGHRKTVCGSCGFAYSEYFATCPKCIRHRSQNHRA
jgi:hypothetical protein